jgi:hypothetical protein
MSPRNFLNVRALVLTALFPLVSRGADPLGPHITKIDPPNWWAGMPKPMLLVQGKHLSKAQFSLSDRG